MLLIARFDGFETAEPDDWILLLVENQVMSYDLQKTKEGNGNVFPRIGL
jgi:hypothetical protein